MYRTVAGMMKNREAFGLLLRAAYPEMPETDLNRLLDAIHLLGYMFQGGPAPALGEQCVRLEGCNNNCSR